MERQDDAIAARRPLAVQDIEIGTPATERRAVQAIKPMVK
jgi:hypothetical protein